MQWLKLVTNFGPWAFSNRIDLCLHLTSVTSNG